LSNAKQHAESIAMITEDLAKKFLEMPTTIEELDCAIQDTESEANSMLFLNQNVLLEYQSRQREIESISIKLEDDKGECERCYSDIEATKVWTFSYCQLYYHTLSKSFLASCLT
jgi:predicted RNase H-like nuclease (RuvC/YqgF family)